MRHALMFPEDIYRVMHKCVSVVLVAAHALSNRWRWFCLFGCFLKLQHVEPSQPFISFSLHFIGWLMKIQEIHLKSWLLLCLCQHNTEIQRSTCVAALVLSHWWCFLKFQVFVCSVIACCELSFLTTTKQQCKTVPLVFEIVQDWDSRTLDSHFCGSVTNWQSISLKHTFSLRYILQQEPAKRELPSPKRNSCNKMMTKFLLNCS